MDATADVANSCADVLEFVRMVLVAPVPLVAQGARDGSFLEGLLDAAREAGVGVDISVSVQQAADEAGGVSRDELFHMLRRDYTHLFAHPSDPAVLPYESLYLHRASGSDAQRPALFVNPVAADVAHCYKRAGLEPSHREGTNLSPDHVSLEVEFFIHLYRTIAARGPEADGARDALEDFFDRHAGRWLPDMFGLAAREARTAFYRCVCTVASSFFRTRPVCGMCG